MAEVVFPKRAPRLTDLERLPKPEDYTRGNAQWVTTPNDENSDAASDLNELGESADSAAQQPLEQVLQRRPLNEIAALISSLTYGEMIELADALWNARPEGSSMTKDTLPTLLHKWSTSLLP